MPEALGLPAPQKGLIAIVLISSLPLISNQLVVMVD